MMQMVANQKCLLAKTLFSTTKQALVNLVTQVRQQIVFDNIQKLMEK